MKPLVIYQKTMAFNWYKLGFGLLTIFICAIILGAAWLIIKQFNLDIFSIIGMGCGAFLVTVFCYYLIMVRQGYSIKIGHIAVIEVGLRSESIPDNQIAYSKDVISQRFGSSAKYYLISRNLTIAITEIGRVIARGFSLDSETPNLGMGPRIKRLLSLPALNYLDECCIAYALRNNDYEVNAAFVDALTILSQNWQKLISSALKTSLLIYIFVLVVAAVIFVPGYAVSNMLMISWIPWLFMSFIIAFVFKIAFLDSYILTKMVCNFLEEAKTTTIDRKNYLKLDHWSKTYSKFRKNAEKIAEKAEDAENKAEREAKKAEREAKKAEREAQKALPAADSKENEAIESAAVAKAQPVSVEVPKEDANKESEVSKKEK